MSFHLRIYENNHYMDENEAYDQGNYSSYKEAECTAKKIVDEFLEHNWKRGMKLENLLAAYALYGEDPVIIPAENPEGKPFSSRDYAVEAATSICRKLDEKHSNMEVQTVYQKAIKFACDKHQKKNQKVKGTELPYVVHLSNVTMEILIAAQNTKNFNLLFAVQVALLHDTIEDTDTKFEDIENNFSNSIAEAVLSLSKDDSLPKDQQIHDSIIRIKKQPKEVWSVKLADRITNLQPAPKEWPREKRKQYLQNAEFILDKLGKGNEYLAGRLSAKIEEYRNQNKKYLLDDF